MDQLNGGYWEVTNERRSRKRTNFFVEEATSPPKTTKKRALCDVKDKDSSESTSPPHKRSKLIHENKLETSEFDDVHDENTDPNIQYESLAYEPQFVYGQPDLTSEPQSDRQPSTIPVHNSTYHQSNDANVVSKSDSSNNNVVLSSESKSQIQRATSLLAVPNLDKEFDSPIKEIKFSFPSDDAEVPPPTDQPLIVAVLDQTDGHSGMANNVNNGQDTIQQSSTEGNKVVDQSVIQPEIPSNEPAHVITEDSSDILLINNDGANPASTAVLERKKSRVIEDNLSQPATMEVENESQIIDEITKANNTEVVTIHSNHLASMQDVAMPRDDLVSELKSEELKSTIKKDDPSMVSAQEIDLRGSNPKIITPNMEKSASNSKKKSDKRKTLQALVKHNYSSKDYGRYMEIGKKLKAGGEAEYCAALVAVLRSNERIMQQYIGHLPVKFQQMCVEAMHAMEQSDESEVHELSQDMIHNADRPATRSTTGPLVFGFQKQIMENPDIAKEVLPAWRGDFVASEDDYGLTQDSSALDAPRADNWSTPTSKKEKEKKLSALQKLKEDKENAKNKPKVVPKATNRPTKYVMPKFGEEDRHKKKNNKISAGGYNIDAGYEDSDESDLEDTVPDEENDWERDYNLPAYGPEFIEKDYEYGFKGEKNAEKRAGSPTKSAEKRAGSPTKKSSSKNSNSPAKEPSSNNTNYRSGSTGTKHHPNSNSRSNNSNNSWSGSDIATPISTINTNSNYGYSNHVPGTLVQTTLERNSFTSVSRSNSGNDLQAANTNNGNTTNLVNIDSSPVSKTHPGHQQAVPATHTSPVAPLPQYTGPKIKIYLNILVLGRKTVITYPTEDNNGMPMTVAHLKDYISKLSNIEVTALKLGEYQLGNDDDAVRDLLSPTDREEVIVEAKDIKKSLATLYRENCQNDGVPVNELLRQRLQEVTPANLYLNSKGLLQARDMQVLWKCLDPNSVEMINFSENSLGNQSAIADLERLFVRQNKSLKSLNLSYCNLTDAHLFPTMTSLHNLQELNISNNSMSDNIGVQFMTVLPNLASLTNLDISRCNFGPLTMKALEDSRFCDNGIYPQNKGVVTVTASFNKLQSTGVNHLTAALCQRTGTSLLTLKLQQVDVHDADQNHCSKALYKLMAHKTARLAELDLSNNSLTARMQWIAQGITDSTYLQTLRLRACELKGDALGSITNVLEFSNSLTALDLSENILGLAGAEMIAEALLRKHKLQQLKLNSCGLTSVGLLAVLRACNSQNVNLNLTRLELENNCDVDFIRFKSGDRLLTEAFSKLKPTLIYLELSKNSINDTDIRNALKQSWEDIHGKDQLLITMSQVSLRFMKKPRKN